MADPGTSGWWGYDPVMTEVEEIKGNKPSQMALKVGQHLAHNLYEYKIEITKIKVREDDKDCKSIYKNADIFVTTYFSKDNNGDYVKIGEYEIEPEHINEGKWFVINEK
ncbi:hypothetical protein COE51_16260 [Bacillus pseudomycoides]|nr:hypothetical protein COE51_16260 [Bacillus pseudomycoides]